MSKPTMQEFLSYELNWEPACAIVLKNAKQPVHSPFIHVTPEGQPSDLADVKDDVCYVIYEPGLTGAERRAWRTPPGLPAGDAAAADAALISEAAGFNGTLVVTRRVPVGDRPAKPGDPPPCYLKLCRELGYIRFALLETENPFRVLLPWIDVLSIEELQPNRQIDAPRSANQHTLRFGVQWMPRAGMW